MDLPILTLKLTQIDKPAHHLDGTTTATLTIASTFDTTCGVPG